MPIGILIVLSGIAGAAVFGILVRERRAAKSSRLRSLRLSDADVAVLSRNVGLYSRLPEELRIRLEGRIQEFRATKKFEGRGGLELTDEMELTIAATAGILLLGRPDDATYPGLSSVIVYPHAFQGKGHRDQSDGSTVRLGESWRIGAVVLSWDDTLGGAHDPEDAHNVVLHEFAHQLDQQDGTADGTPNLGRRPARYATWGRVLGKEFLELRQALSEGRETWLNAYGATNEAEFFAVATEFFFEKPKQMKQREPELYAELEGFYGLDPASWIEGNGARSATNDPGQEESR